jgi:hypothetical protein
MSYRLGDSVPSRGGNATGSFRCLREAAGVSNCARVNSSAAALVRDQHTG